MDTLAWARRGVRVTGIGISERGIEQARLLAAEAHPFAARLPLLFSLKATKA